MCCTYAAYKCAIYLSSASYRYIRHWAPILIVIDCCDFLITALPSRDSVQPRTRTMQCVHHCFLHC